jgi:hypothetical protein
MLHKITIILLTFDLYIFIRNGISYKNTKFAINLISAYTKTIPYGEYEFGKDYYEEMKISYFRHIFSFWLWGKYSVIKPQYREMLKEYEHLI